MARLTPVRRCSAPRAIALARARNVGRLARQIGTNQRFSLARGSCLLALLLATVIGSPARAQVALGLAVESDYRFRGYSLSAGRPTAALNLAYDDPSGLYLNGSLIGFHRRDGPDLLGYQANIGYARRLGPIVSVDAGLVHSQYRFPYYGRTRSRSYTEAYVAAHVRDFTARVFYSPHYFRDGVSTVYGEVEAAYQPSPNWRLNAHAGVLTYLATPAYFDSRTSYDWRLSASRQFGAAEVHAAVSGGGPGEDYYDGRAHDRTALTVGASLNF